MFGKTARLILWLVGLVLALVLCAQVIIRGDYSVSALWLPAVALILFGVMTLRFWTQRRA